MKTLHILSAGFANPNSRAFLFPLVTDQARLKNAGVVVRFFTEHSAEVLECDVLGIESKFQGRRWVTGPEGMENMFAALSARVDRLVYFDTADSTGTLEPRVLPYVQTYFKSQLLRDRSLYAQAMYGQRIYTDYFHREQQIEDASPYTSAPVPEEYLGKFAVSWNSALGDYSNVGPYAMALYRRVPVQRLLRRRVRFVPALRERPVDVSLRMNIGYDRATVARQRVLLAERLRGRVDTSKLPRREYLDELSRSKIVASPFGLGEITLKDFEVFIGGAALLKPDMAHLETFPDLYSPGETVLTHAWDASDVDAVIDSALSDPEGTKQIAAQGQDRYKEHLSDSGRDRFAERVANLI